jgi:hypothetical protein
MLCRRPRHRRRQRSSLHSLRQSTPLCTQSVTVYAERTTTAVDLMLALCLFRLGPGVVSPLVGG